MRNDAETYLKTSLIIQMVIQGSCFLVNFQAAMNPDNHFYWLGIIASAFSGTLLLKYLYDYWILYRVCKAIDALIGLIDGKKED